MDTVIETDRYTRWMQAGLSDQSVDRNDALAILDGRGIDLLPLLQAAGRIREKYFGRQVTIHILDNIRNGACPEDCGYCGQSKDSDAAVKPYKLKSVDQIIAAARVAQERGAYRFCMAMSGRGPCDRDVDHMCEAIRQIKALGIRTCLSAGLLDPDKAQRLKEAGLDRLNHNLNTSREHYPQICTTHTYDDRLKTLRAAQDAGIGLCSGLIVGMGQMHKDLLDVAYSLRELGAESIPVNFLLPLEGNRVNQPSVDGRPMDPQFVLRMLCMMRLVNPTAEVRIAAGREFHLRSLQPMSLWPANSLFMEGYLLTQGQEAQDTIRMILDAGFTPAFDQPDAVSPELRRLIQEGATPLPQSSRATLKLSVSRATA